MFFAGLFAIYFTLRNAAPEQWAAESALLNIPFSLTNTLLLVASSFTAQFGVFAAERLQPRATGWKPTQWGMVEWFFLTYAMGAVFVAGQVYEYAILVSEGVTLDSNAYGAAFYLTTGFHGLHVTGGLIAFLLVIGRAYAVKNFGHKEATSAIGDIVRANRPIVRLHDIEQAVCKAFGLEHQKLQTKSKCQSLSQPRMLAMFLARKHTRTALSEIGEYFGNRQHSTVISAQKKVESWIEGKESLQVGNTSMQVPDILRSLEASLQVG